MLRLVNFLSFTILSGCQYYSINNHKNESELTEKISTSSSHLTTCSDKNIGEGIAIINKNVQHSKKITAWPPNYNLSDKTIVISTTKALIFYTNTNSTKEINKIKELSEELVRRKLHLICFDKSNSSIYPTAIFQYTKPELASNLTSYSFVYPTFTPRLSNNQVNLNYVSNKLGSFLYIYLPSTSDTDLTEMQRTLTHEGAHFFGQSKIINLQPLIVGTEIDSRSYLSTNYEKNSHFRGLVNQELCIASSLLEGVLVYPKKSKNDINDLLYQMWIIRKERNNINEVDIIEAENFWYLVEGIPQFLDHNVLIEKKQISKLINSYKLFCEEDYISNFSFYPLYAGAAVAAGIEYSNGSLEYLKANSEFNSSGLLKWNIMLNFQN